MVIWQSGTVILGHLVVNLTICRNFDHGLTRNSQIQVCLGQIAKSVGFMPESNKVSASHCVGDPSHPTVSSSHLGTSP
jgi:hypothetical protein